MDMVLLLAALLFIGLLGYKLKLPYQLTMGAVLLTVALVGLEHINALPVLVVLYFMAPAILAIKPLKWQGALFCLGIVLPQLVQMVMMV
ncbi:hypothetical protein VCJ_002896 [Vibrio metoecus]|nr:hypothetical protein [Vibrio metoecus]EEX64363.1 hypothetical protein VCJ_002896 [Vibrio metoecus]